MKIGRAYELINTIITNSLAPFSASFLRSFHEAVTFNGQNLEALPHLSWPSFVFFQTVRIFFLHTFLLHLSFNSFAGGAVTVDDVGVLVLAVVRE